jgi:hypothetical protein
MEDLNDDKDQILPKSISVDSGDLEKLRNEMPPTNDRPTDHPRVNQTNMEQHPIAASPQEVTHKRSLPLVPPLSDKPEMSDTSSKSISPPIHASMTSKHATKFGTCAQCGQPRGSNTEKICENHQCKNLQHGIPHGYSSEREFVLPQGGDLPMTKPFWIPNSIKNIPIWSTNIIRVPPAPPQYQSQPVNQQPNMGQNPIVGLPHTSVREIERAMASSKPSNSFNEAGITTVPLKTGNAMSVSSLCEKPTQSRKLLTTTAQIGQQAASEELKQLLPRTDSFKPQLPLTNHPFPVFGTRNQSEKFPLNNLPVPVFGTRNSSELYRAPLPSHRPPPQKARPLPPLPPFPTFPSSPDLREPPQPFQSSDPHITQPTSLTVWPKNWASKGIYKKGSKYGSQIIVDGKIHHIGTYNNAADAAVAYNVEAEKHGLHLHKINVPERAPPKKKRKRNYSPGEVGDAQSYTSHYNANGEIIYLGRWATPEQAAVAFDREVVRRGRDAHFSANKLNFPFFKYSMDVMTAEEEAHVTQLEARAVLSILASMKSGAYVEAHARKDLNAISAEDHCLQQSMFPTRSHNWSYNINKQNFRKEKKKETIRKRPAKVTNNKERVKKQKKENHSGSKYMDVVTEYGFRGVYMIDSSYVAKILVNGVSKQIGYYDTAEDAAVAFDYAILAYQRNKKLFNFTLGPLVSKEARSNVSESHEVDDE